MLRDGEIARAAQLMLELYGSMALVAAELHASRLSASGQRDAAAIWREVVGAIRQRDEVLTVSHAGQVSDPA
jgi:hypothetical protein